MRQSGATGNGADLERRSHAGFEVTTIPGLNDAGDCLALSPRGDLIATGKNKTIFLWQLKGDPKAVPQLTGHAGEVQRLAFYPDGLRLASLAEEKHADGKSSAELKVWDVQARKELFAAPMRTVAPSGGLAFSDDGRMIVVPDLNKAHIYDENGKRVLSVPERKLLVFALALSSANKMLAVAGILAGNDGYEGGVVFLWNLMDGKNTHMLKVGAKWAHQVAFSADGKNLAVCGSDNEVSVWDVDSGRELAFHADHTQNIFGLTFLGDTEMIASAAADRTLRLWQWKTDRGARATAGTAVVRFPTEVKTLVTATDGTFLATDSHGHVYRWKGARQDYAMLQRHRRPIECLAFNADGSRLATRSFDGTLKIIDTKTRKETLTAATEGSGHLCAAFSPDGRWLAVNNIGADKTVKEITLFDARNGTAAYGWPAGREAVSHLAFSPDSMSLASVAAESRTVSFWAVQPEPQQSRVPTIPPKAEPIVAVAYRPDGGQFAAAGPDGVDIWNPRTGQYERRFLSGKAKVLDIAFSADGRRLACAVSGAGSERFLKVYDVESGEPLTSAANAESRDFVFHSGALNRGGTRMVVADQDEVMKIVETRTGREVLTFPDWRMNRSRLAIFSPDGHLLAAVAESGDILGSSTVALFDGSPWDRAQ